MSNQISFLATTVLLAAVPCTLAASAAAVGSPWQQLELVTSTIAGWNQKTFEIKQHLPDRRPNQPWPYRQLDSTLSFGVEMTNTHALVATVRHAPLTGVTTDMLMWWFKNVEGDGVYVGDGLGHSKYLMWHPRDHIYQTTVKAAHHDADLSGELWEICEFFLCTNPDGYIASNYPGTWATEQETIVKAVTQVQHLNSSGLWMAVPSATGVGDTFWSLHHTWVDTPNGVLINSTQTVGVIEPNWRPSFYARGRNAIVRGLFAKGRNPFQNLHRWLQHCVEEIGNLEHILPSLYASHGDQQGNSQPSKPLSSNSDSPASANSEL